MIFDRALEEQIAQWRTYVSRRRASDEAAVASLEEQLRAELARLAGAGLPADEALLIALKRIGGLDASSREFARFYAERLLKPLPAWDQPSPKTGRGELLLVLGTATVAALAVKAPEAYGIRLNDDPGFYLRNASLFVFPLLAAYFGWKRGLGLTTALWLAVAFVAAAVFANAFPFRKGGDTEALTALHLPIALWLAVGVAYLRGRWFRNGGRMDFVRFSGELAIYYVLIALGGGVLSAVTVTMFRAIGMKAEWLARDWLVPCGAAGAFIVAAWLAEIRQTLPGNIAPLLTRLFTPLFTALLLAFLATMAWTGQGIRVERGVLIGFDLLLALVVGLVLYAVSARDPDAPPGFFDALQLLLVASALVIDLSALAAIAARISAMGFTPNRLAALGENVILLVNLAGSAFLYARFLLGKSPFAALERWQLAYLPVYPAWAALVVIAFPPLFGYR